MSPFQILSDRGWRNRGIGFSEKLARDVLLTLARLTIDHIYLYFWRALGKTHVRILGVQPAFWGGLNRLAKWVVAVL